MGFNEGLRSTALQYFMAFARKDIAGLRNHFSPDVTLSDWEINASGRDAVLDANAKIFGIAESITVRPLNVYLDGNTIIAELDVAINDSGPIKVVDIIEFTDSGKICAIRAFKG